MGRKTWFEAVLENGYDPTTQLAADRAVQQAGGQIRDHPGFGPAQHDAARPGAAGGNGGAHAEQQSGSHQAKGQGFAALSEEDLGMVKDLLVAGMSRAGSGFESAPRLYRG